MDLGDAGYFAALIIIIVMMWGGAPYIQDMIDTIDNEINGVEIDVEEDEGV